MVTADISQLSGECNTWRESLRSSRDEINQLKHRLQQAASQTLSKDQLQDVEHYHNQFHIQLINVHDLKQSIKAHDRRVNFEMSAHKGQISEDTLAEHEHLLEEYQTLDNTLQSLREEFSSFINRTN
jgi:chromosome segregation ATPase